MATIKELFNNWKEKFDSIISKSMLHLNNENQTPNHLLKPKKPVLVPVRVRR